MTFQAKTTPKRGRPPLPEDNATREAILIAARRLFAARSFTQVSLREITADAGVSLAAVNYHFVSKEGLIKAVFSRAAPELIAERQQLLGSALEIEDMTERTRGIIYALLKPIIQWGSLEDTQTFIVPFLSRARLDGPQWVKQRAGAEVGHLQPFLDALETVLPDLPKAELIWRFHFILGIEHVLIAEVERLKNLSDGACDMSDCEAVTQRVIDFVVPGLLQPAVNRQSCLV